MLRDLALILLCHSLLWQAWEHPLPSLGLNFFICNLRPLDYIHGTLTWLPIRTTWGVSKNPDACDLPSETVISLAPALAWVLEV